MIHRELLKRRERIRWGRETGLTKTGQQERQERTYTPFVVSQLDLGLRGGSGRHVDRFCRLGTRRSFGNGTALAGLNSDGVAPGSGTIGVEGGPSVDCTGGPHGLDGTGPGPVEPAWVGRMEERSAAELEWAESLLPYPLR